MSEFKGTPGPWHMSTGDPNTKIPRIYTIDDGPIADSIHADTVTRIANARLISAAPELLEACQLAHARCQNMGDDWFQSETARALRAAIAKALGKEVQ